MIAVVNIISGCGLNIDVHRTSKPNRYKLALYKPLIYICSHLKQLKYITRWYSSVLR